jgi:hypothetical protein
MEAGFFIGAERRHTNQSFMVGCCGGCYCSGQYTGQSDMVGRYFIPTRKKLDAVYFLS